MVFLSIFSFCTLLYLFGVNHINWIGPTVVTTLCIVLIIAFWRKKGTVKSVTVNNETVVERQQEALQKALDDMATRLENMTGTPHLIEYGPDIAIQPLSLVKEEYETHFTPWDRGDHIFPAIDQLFANLLETEGNPVEATVRPFAMRGTSVTPFTAFMSFQRDPLKYALSAKQILLQFLQTKESLIDQSWYILNTKPGKPERFEDLRFVEIKRQTNVTRKGQHFIICYPFAQWDAFGGGYLTPKNKPLFFMEVKKEN